MPSLFSAPTLAPGANLPPRPLQEVERTPPGQSRGAASGAAYGDAPQGAGAPAATGAANAPSAAQPQPAATPPVSSSQAGKLTAMVITMQARTEQVEAKEQEVEAEEAQTEAIRESAEPRGTEQETLELRDERKELREGDSAAKAIADESAEEVDPARAAAAKYRDANETTAGAEPARLLMDA